MTRNHQQRTLIVTGAGASRYLGADERPLPLMPDWSSNLTSRLGPELSAALELGDDLDGEQFERRLGRLFALRKSLNEFEWAAQIASPPPHHDQGLPTKTREAIGVIRGNLATLTSTLHESLFELFGPARIDAAAASMAYFDLFRMLELTAVAEEPPSNLILATTNYDRSVEIAFEHLGIYQSLRTGQDGQKWSTPKLRPAGLGTYQDLRPSLLYLHGAVGWYQNANDEISCLASDEGFNSVHGTPAVLYPDDRKDVVGSATSAIWEEFRNAANLADRILVLGHSLHDSALVETLNSSPAALGVCFHSQSKTSAAVKRIDSLIPGAIPIGIDFRVGLKVDRAALELWRSAEPRRLKVA